MIDDTSIEIFKRTLRIRSIHNEYRKNILKNLIDIYYENYEGETLEKYLIRLDIRLLGSEERGSIIEYYIQRGLDVYKRQVFRTGQKLKMVNGWLLTQAQQPS